MSYLDATNDLYKEAALTPDVGLCCTTNPIWELPGLKIPRIMQEMNYGCGSTVHARDLTNNPKMLYVGVGGGIVVSVAVDERLLPYEPINPNHINCTKSYGVNWQDLLLPSEPQVQCSTTILCLPYHDTALQISSGRPGGLVV